MWLRFPSGKGRGRGLPRCRGVCQPSFNLSRIWQLRCLPGEEHLNRVPLLILAFAAILGATVVGFSARLAMLQPYLGVQLKGGQPFVGAVVTTVDPRGPSSTILTPRDVILKIGDITGRWFVIEPADLVRDPDFFPTFAILNGFYARQAALQQILESPVVSLQLEDGRVLHVQPTAERPLSALPFDFWLINLIGFVALLAGFSIWSIRRHERAPRFLLGTGVFFLLLASTVAIISTRELTMSVSLLKSLQRTYHAWNGFFTISLIGLLWHYPRQLFRIPVLPLLLMMVLPFWLNEVFQWHDLPGHSILFQLPIFFLIAVIIAVIQWRRVRHRPADRAAYRWFSMSLFVCDGLALLVYYLPMTLKGSHEVPLAVGLGIMLLLYLGLAMGVLRYRLFNLDRWWFDVWLWFLAGVVLVSFDVGLVFLASLSQPIALTISLLLVGWCYFPLRIWVWNRIYRPSRRPVAEVLPMLISTLLENPQSASSAMAKGLRGVFRPSRLQEVAGEGEISELREDGEILYVPSLEEDKGFSLYFADRGARLFSEADLRVANSLHRIARQTEDRLRAYTEGAEEERERIMRDLHDEIGGRLLSIVHSAPTVELSGLARDALRSLRDIIYSLGQEGPLDLSVALGKWHYDCKERCSRADVQLNWGDAEEPEGISLSARQWVNLSRVLYEAVSNVLKHASPTSFDICWHLDSKVLRGSIRNDGVRYDSEQITVGKGLKNIENRIVEIGGQFRYAADFSAGTFAIELQIPLSGNPESSHRNT